MFVDLGTVHAFVFKQYAALVFPGAVCEVEVNESGYYHQQNEEGAQKNLHLILFLQQEPRHCDRNIVVSGSIGISVL